MKTVIVTGSRDHADTVLIHRVLNILCPIDLLVQGGARGADRIAKEWAEHYKVPSKTVAANWDAFGKSAGAIRNIEMLEMYPGALVVAFPLPHGRGTQHCIFEAKRRGHTIFVVIPDGKWTIIGPRDERAEGLGL